ncbi:MAG: DNA polymerase Y family protein [Pseudomonadota bacterium]
MSLWFPRLAAERLLRQARGTVTQPFAVVEEVGNMQTLASLSLEASAAGLRVGQPLRDARAMCPDLLTSLTNRQAEAAFLKSLRRWAGKFSPWVADHPPASLVLDLTGCAHLFGGETELLAQVEDDCADLRLSVQVGVADTVGAAWALARYAGAGPGVARTGDAIDMEARATRSRAAKRRHWERGGAPPSRPQVQARTARIAAPGQTRTALASLPVAALRLPEATLAQLMKLGLRRVEDLAGQPRAALARRFGQDLLLRLDQAMGTAPEPVSPARAPLHFACRLTLPEPIGLEEDVTAGIDRLLPPLCAALKSKGRGARRVRLQVFRCDHTGQTLEVGLARPSHEPDRLRPLLLMKLGDVDAGPGIDVLRLEAHVTEPVHAHQHKGHLNAAADVAARLAGDTALDDLIGKLGARVGLDAITRIRPGDSHIPEKTSVVLAAAFSDAAQDWPRQASVPRPLLLHTPEPVSIETPGPSLPERFRWRRRDLRVTGATGPERIAPEWWFDDPAWRSGQRDYWRVETDAGDRLWLYYAHGGATSAGWFCQGSFA